MTDRERPDLSTFPTGLEVRFGLDGVEGCRRAALAAYLGCTENVLKPLLGSPVGHFAHSNKLYPLWDKHLVFDLVDHPDVIASRRRRAKRVTPRKRELLLQSHIASWDVSGAELVGAFVRGFRSVAEVFVPLDGTTVLIGKNGVGKTNILEAVAHEVGSETTRGRFRASSQSPGGFGFVYRLRPQDEGDLDAFLEAYLYRLGDQVVHDVAPLLGRLLREPLVVAWRDRHGDRTLAGLTATLVAMDVGDMAPLNLSADTMSAVLNDPWLSNVCRVTAEAPAGIRLVAALPTMVPTPVLTVAALEGDPRRLRDEVEEKLSSLMQPKVSTPSGHQWFLEEFLPRDAEADDPSWIVGLDEVEPVWLSWMSAPSALSPAELMGLARVADPDIHLAPPSAETQWIAAGTGALSVSNAFAVASTFDREAVRMTLRRAMQLVQHWIVATGDAVGDIRGTHWLTRLFRDGRAIAEALGIALFSDEGTASAGSAWLRHAPLGASLRPQLLELLRQIEHEANQIAPLFVRTQGRIVLNVLPPATWAVTGQKLSIRFVTGGNLVLDLADLGRGVQRWAAASVREALRQVAADSEKEPTASDGPRRDVALLLVDEPEMALHPEAQDQVAKWCVRAGHGGQRVLIATHSPAMLELSPTDATIVKVSMVRDVTEVEPLDVAALEGLDRLADSLGLGRSGLLHVPRGFIIVEGPADAAVLSGLLGAELRRQRIVPIPLHGAYKYRALVQPELLKAMGKPMAVMFDDVRRDVLDGKRLPVANEEKTLLTLIKLAPEIHPISFDAPDIVAALPDDAVRRVVPDFPGWNTILDGWNESPGGFENFKTYAMDRCRRSGHQATAFITEVLEQAQPDDALPLSFRRAASEILAWAESLSPIGNYDTNEWDSA